MSETHKLKALSNALYHTICKRVSGETNLSKLLISYGSLPKYADEQSTAESIRMLLEDGFLVELEDHQSQMGYIHTDGLLFLLQGYLGKSNFVNAIYLADLLQRDLGLRLTADAILTLDKVLVTKSAEGKLPLELYGVNPPQTFRYMPIVRETES